MTLSVEASASSQTHLADGGTWWCGGSGRSISGGSNHTGSLSLLVHSRRRSAW